MGHYQFLEANHKKTIAEPVVEAILHFVQPKSVLDIGCGTGNFLAVFKDQGISDVFGLDAPWVQESDLMVDTAFFKHHDFEKPFVLDRKFDLTISLEVGHHLSPNAAADFVASITQTSDVILFSTAVPLQGGQYHYNEQWPSFWMQLFEKHGFVAIDAFRPYVWNNTSLKYWYKQNLLFFVKPGHPLEKHLRNFPQFIPDLIHPDLFHYHTTKLNRLLAGNGYFYEYKNLIFNYLKRKWKGRK
jgi:SAM-dependent methyltransferase